MQTYTIQAVIATTGFPLPGASITVYATGTTTKATLYDVNGSPISNPFDADATTGIAVFQVADGTYDIIAASGSYVGPTRVKVQIYDLAAAIAAFTVGAVTYEGAYASGTTYAQGQGVTYSEQIYISLVAGNVGNTPSSSPTYWQAIIGLPALNAAVATEASTRAAADTTLTTNVANIESAAFANPAVVTSGASAPMMGSTARWADQLVTNGGSLSSGSYNAVQQAEEMLRAFDLMRDLIYFNPLCGGNLISARTPLVDLFGNRLATVVSGSGFSEGSGLTGVVLDTGIIPDYAGVSRLGFTMGVYSLTSLGSSGAAGNYAIGYNDGTDTAYGIQPNDGGDMIFDWYGAGGRSSGAMGFEYGDSSISYISQGVLIGSRDAAGRGTVWRNNVPLVPASLPPATVALPALGQRIDNTSPLSTGAISLISTTYALGAAFVALGDFDVNKAAAMTFILQTLNKNFGTPRAVYPDGLT